jgi:hypothetical protein
MLMFALMLKSTRSGICHDHDYNQIAVSQLVMTTILAAACKGVLYCAGVVANCPIDSNVCQYQA